MVFLLTNESAEVDDWTEWLDDAEDNKTKNTSLLQPSVKNDEIRKQILQNDINDINDFLDISDEKREDNKEEIKENKTKQKTKTYEKIIQLENTPLNSIKDCEMLGTTLGVRIKTSNLKSAALERFLSILLNASESKLDDKELKSINRKIQEILERREKQKRETAMKKKKPNEIKNKIKNYQDEVDMIYGELSYDEDDPNNDYTDDYYDYDNKK
ncbi:conserved protein, unknown function [Hepatocystis sp. ex Piliocolobus tephrosceles]|nr:conserved protein, unknown function [Hepatocystis sp. ex Piliocolobus tephrosceles]